jgi:hypothetical protein
LADHKKKTLSGPLFAHPCVRGINWSDICSCNIMEYTFLSDHVTRAKLNQMYLLWFSYPQGEPHPATSCYW